MGAYSASPCRPSSILLRERRTGEAGRMGEGRERGKGMEDGIGWKEGGKEREAHF